MWSVNELQYSSTKTRKMLDANSLSSRHISRRTIAEGNDLVTFLHNQPQVLKVDHPGQMALSTVRLQN
jgi:hypothetical protein